MLRVMDRSGEGDSRTGAGSDPQHPRVRKLRMPHAIAVAGRPIDVQRRRRIQLHRGLEPQ